MSNYWLLQSANFLGVIDLELFGKTQLRVQLCLAPSPASIAEYSLKKFS